MADAPKPGSPPAVTTHAPPKELPQQAQTQKFQGRPKRTPEDQAAYFYNIRTMHILFFVSSLGLLAGVVGMMMKDWVRSWKDYQRTYAAMDLARVESEIQHIHESMTSAEGERRRLALQIQRLEAELPAKKIDVKTVDPATGAPKVVSGTLGELQAEKTKIAGEHADKMQAMNFVKSDYMTFRWRFEEAKHLFEHAKDIHDKRILVYESIYEREKRRWDQVNRDVERAKADFDAIDRLMTDLDNAITELSRPLEDTRAAAAKLDKEFADRIKRVKREMPQLANTIRNAPGLDFFDPTLKVQQVILSDVMQNFNFVKVERIDRCHTCHQGIGNPTYATVQEETPKGSRIRFKDPYLALFTAHAAGEGEPKDCPICRQKEKGLPADDGGRREAHVLVDHGAWGSEKADEYVRALSAHPRLDLYVSGSSPHPIARFGCTVCHEGDGRDTEFSLAYHVPNDREQQKQWKSRHGYEFHPPHLPRLWDEPMLPQKHVYASCRKCHINQVELDGGDDYVKGMKLYERLGCYACHRTDSYQVLPKDQKEIDLKGGDPSRKYRRPGPPLTHIADKTTPDWAAKWVLSPKDFRLSTRMPHFFGQSNSRTVKAADGTVYGPEQVEGAIAQSIVEFLFNTSETRAYADLPATAHPPSATRGAQLFEQVGCRSCHTATPDGSYEARKDIRNDDDVLRSPDGKSWYLDEFGPNLSAMGSKTNAKWLYAWLRDPKHYFAQTRMGSFRLSEQEAVDVVQYLMSLRKKAFDEKPAPAAPAPALLDQLIFEQKRSKMPDVDAWADVKAMEPRSKTLWFGRKMVSNYGCYSCHEMRPEPAASRPDAIDWTDIEGIGVELTGAQPEGVKAVDRLAFGFTHYDGHNHLGVSFVHPVTKKEYRQVGTKDVSGTVKVGETRHDWIDAKLLNPRIFDGGKEASLPPDELLKMPNFYLTPEETRLLTTFVLSFKDHDIPHQLVEKVKKRPSADEQVIARGERLVRESNCRGCHRMSLDRFQIDWTRVDDKGKTKTTPEWVEGRMASEIEPAEVKDWLARWKRPHADRPGQRLFTYKWISDPCTMAMEAVVDPKAPYVHFDGEDWWYLNADFNEVKSVAKIHRVVPQDGGDILPIIRAYKKEHGEEYWIQTDSESQYEGRFPPMLRSQGVKTQAEWLFSFLKHPTIIRPGLNITLPDVRDIAAPPDDVAKRAAELIAKLGDEDEEVADDAQKELKKQGRAILALLRTAFEGAESTTVRARLLSLMGVQAMADVNVRMPTFGFNDEEAAALARYFWTRDQLRGVDTYPHTAMIERDPEYLAKRAALIDDVRKNDVEKNCVQCHFYDGKPAPGGPDAGYKYGPDFNQMENRLRPRWLHPWLKDPGVVYPGTTMTLYQWDEKDPARDEDRRRATVEFMLNFRRLRDAARN